MQEDPLGILKGSEDPLGILKKKDGGSVGQKPTQLQSSSKNILAQRPEELPLGVPKVGAAGIDRLFSAASEAKSKLDQAVSSRDDIYADIIKENRLKQLDTESRAGLSDMVNPALQSARKGIITQIPVTPKEIQSQKDVAITNPNAYRDVLKRAAKKDPEIAKNAYLVDAEQRAMEKPEAAEKILQNADKIANGELNYSVGNGVLQKPEGAFVSLYRGLQERNKQVEDYDFLTKTLNDDAIIAQLEDDRTRIDPDEPQPTPSGALAEFGMMTGMEGKAIAKSALAGLATGLIPGGQAAAPYVAAFVSSPEYYQRGYSTALRAAYNEFRQRGDSEYEALQKAREQAETDANLSAAEGLASGFIGAKIGFKPTEFKVGSGFNNALKNTLVASKNFVTENLVEGGTDAAIAGGLQVAKNISAIEAGLDRGVFDDLGATVAGEIAFTTTLGAVIKAGKIVVNPKDLNTLVTGLARQPKEVVDAKIGELVVNGFADPQEAADAGKLIDEARKIDSQIPSTVQDEDTRVVIGEKIKEREALKAELATANEAFHKDIKDKIQNIDNEILNYATTESSKPVQEGAAESNIGEPTGVVQGQREGGTGEGVQGEATLPKADVGDSNLGSEAKITPDQISVSNDPTDFAAQMQSAQSSLGKAGMSVSPYTQEAYDEVASEGGKFLRAADNKVLALLKPSGEMVSLVKDATVKAKGAAQAMISKMKDMGGLFMDNYDIYLTPIYEKAGYKVVARVPFDEQYAPEGWNEQDSPLKNKPDVVFMVRNDIPAQEQSFTNYDDAQNYVKGIVDSAVSSGIAKTPSQMDIETELTQELIKDPVAKVQQSLKSAGITVDLIADPAEFDRQVQQLGGQAGMEGVFLADDGKVLLNEQKLKEGTNAGRIIFHEATHPIINIIRNTNPALYNRVVAGINAASDNPAIQQAKAWVESNKNVYDTDVKKEDETLVETIAMVGDGTLDLNTIETGFKQALIEVINTIARALGFKPVLNDTDVAAFKKLAAQIADVLTSGRDIAELVGRENVKEFQATGLQARATESDENPAFFENIKDFANKSSFANKVAFKEAVQERLKSYIPELKKIYGKKFDPSVYNEDTKKYLSDVLTKEAVNAISAHPEAIGWYDDKTQSSLAAISAIHPEIATDMAARGEFILPLAVMSNGNKVDKNFDYAEEQYRIYKETGRYNPNGDFGAQQVGIKKSLKLINSLLDNGLTMSEVSNFLTSKHKAGDLKYRKPDGKLGDLVSGELATEDVYGAVILGPKIGNGFYMNLWGQFDQLTMDRWFMRTWGRLTGTLIDRDKDLISNGKKRISSAIQSIKSDKDASKILKDAIGSVSNMPASDIANAIEKVTAKKDIRNLLSSNPKTDEIRKAGNGLAKLLRGEKEAPSNGEERKFIRSVFSDVQRRLKEENGIDITMADLQAVMWYPEKILYESFKEGESFEGASEGYTEDSAPDYFNAAKKIAKKLGATDEQINQAVSEGRRYSAERAGRRDTSTGETVGRDDQEVLRQIRQVKGGAADLTKRSRVQASAGNRTINWEKSKEGKGDPSISSRNPIVQEAAKNLKEGKITNEEYRATVSENSPITPITRFFEPATEQEIRNAFSVSTKKDKEAENIGKPVEEGTKVGLRLDIPSYTFNNTWVVSVHEGHTKSGRVISYGNVARIKNVSFEPIPVAALNIAAGEASKTSVARMYGEWVNIEGDTLEDKGENAKEIVQNIVNDPNYVQVGMNPFRHSYFYDRSSDMGRPIVSADEVVQIGGLVYAKNPVYGNWTDEAYRVKGLFDSAGKAVQFSAGNREIINGFYSPIQKRVNEFKQPKASVQKWKEIVGTKTDEAVFSGLADWLGGMKPDRQLTKEEVNNFMSDNRIEINEVEKSDKGGYEVLPDDEGGYSAFRIDNGEKITESSLDIGVVHDMAQKVMPSGTKYSEYQLPRGENYKEILVTLPGKDQFKSSHFDETNIITHLRMNTRTDVDGNKILFLEEVQSDWGQKGKREGFDVSNFTKEEQDRYFDLVGRTNLTEAELIELKALIPKRVENKERPKGIPSAPYVTNTNAWVKLGLKVALKEAIRQGADRIAWTTGQQQSDRYDLSKTIESIKATRKAIPVLSAKKGPVSPVTYRVDIKYKNGEESQADNVSESELSDYFGKELADRIIADKGGKYSDVDLKVGSKGMKDFYGDAQNVGIVGKVAKALVKELTGKEGEIVVSKISTPQLPKDISVGEIQAAGGVDAVKAKQMSDQPAIDITPELVQAVEGGLPQFSAGNRPENNQNFKLAAFVMRKKAEGATDGEIAIGIASVTGMKPQDIKTIIDNPEQFIRDSFPSMSKLQQDNLIQKAKIQDIYRGRQFGKPIDKPFMGLEVPQEMVDDYLDKTGRADKTVKDWAKDFKRKWLDPAKGLPDWTLAIKDFATGAKNIEVARAANTIQRLKDTAKQIGFKDWDAFSEALVAAKDVQRFIPDETGVVPFDVYRAAANRTFATPDDKLPALVPDAIKKLPDEIIPFAYAMRGQIDNLTRDLIGSGYVTPEQAVVLEKNLGAYTNRAYKMFSERGYVPEKKVYNAAVKFLTDQKLPQLQTDNVGVLTDKQITEKAIEEAKKDVEIYLSKKKNPYFGSKSDRRDTGILQERKDIPEPIRNLMGQYTDPGTVFIMTVAKQAALKSASQYLNKLRIMGMGTLFFEREDPSRPVAEYTVEIAPKGSESMNPLGGLLTTKEIAEALDMVDPTYNDLTETWMKLVGMVRWGKTVGSVATQFKNFESNGGFAVLNGYMLSGENTQAFKAAAKYVKGQYSKGEIDAITDKVIRLNLVGQSVGMRELKEMLGSGDVHDIAVDIALNPEGKWGKRVAKRVDVLGAANKLYRLGDDFWKVYAYMVEREQISDARFNGAKYDSLTKQQQEQVDIESSERVKNTWPTYDRVVEGAKFVSKRAPIFGNFISFQAESLRALTNSIKLAKQDLSDPQMRHLGVRRMAGITAYIGLRSAITIGLAKMAGFAAAGILGSIFGDDEEERNKRAIREALPPFMRTGDLAVTQGEKPHQYTVVNMSSLDPYGVVPNSLNAFTEGREGIFGRTMEPGILAAGTELFSGFLEPEMTFETMWSVINNKDPKTGEQLVMETDTDLQASAKVAAKIWDQLEPSTVSMIQRLYERDNKEAELLALGGARPYDVDLHKSFGFVLSRFGKDIDAINKEYNNIKYNDKMTEQEKEAAEKVAEDKKAFAISKVSQIYRDFINIGADPKVLDELINQKSAVKVTGYDKNTKKSIKTGKISKEKLFK